jgi:hypothetical protein
MALLKVMLPLTGMVEVLTELQFNRFVETCSTQLLLARPEMNTTASESGRNDRDNSSTGGR